MKARLLLLVLLLLAVGVVIWRADRQPRADTQRIETKSEQAEPPAPKSELEQLAAELCKTGPVARKVTILGTAPGERPNLFPRLIGFLQGSWRELQRVQWPDRRQVAQATGVVIGFVIVAGVFLGLSDLVAQKLVNYILK